MARILITGASRGIGRGAAVELAGRGHEVIATARDVSALDEVPAAVRLSLDVTDQASVDAAIARAGHFGVFVHVLQPGAVASGGAERARVYLDEANPYRPLLDKIGVFRAAPIPVEDVADVIAETVDQGAKAAFRIPVGDAAKTVLAARKAAPEDAPFLPASLDW
jgi:NAD(P)-dependent dehydrogenase (short-subunit alcohol dehydrogenase family)